MHVVYLIAAILASVVLIFITIDIISEINRTGVCKSDAKLRALALGAAWRYDRTDKYLRAKDGYLRRTKFPESILFKWYVGNVGMIPRWYKASRIIDKIHRSMTSDIDREAELIHKYFGIETKKL